MLTIPQMSLTKLVAEVERGQKYSKFVFVSDQDKGLEKSLQDVFPNNHATHCIHHIKQNVTTRHSKPCADFVFRLASSYSTIQKEKFIKQIWTVNMKKIPLHHWHSTECMNFLQGMEC